MMHENHFGFTMVRVFVYSLVIGLLIIGLTLEAQNAKAGKLFDEFSGLEYVQEILLFMVALFASVSGRMDPSQRGLSTLLAGAAVMCLIRELDFFLDTFVFDGAWQILCAITFFLILFSVYPLRATLKSSIHDFINNPCFGIMVSGFLTVFVFSRLFGRKVLWEAVMHEGYISAVKNAAEEGTELLGYCLIFISTFEYFLDCSVNHRLQSIDPSDTSNQKSFLTIVLLC